MNDITNISTSNLMVHVKKLAENSDFYTGREGQVACSVSDKVYVFGGVQQGQGDEPKETNELLVFDVGTGKWSKPAVTGSEPPPRSAASLVAVGTRLYLFGGLSHMCGWFDDLHVFDTVNNTWSILDTEGSRPRARDKLQAVVVDSNVYYFGGFGPKSDEAELDDLHGGDDDEEDDEEYEDIPESQQQEAAEFGWFNDLYMLDTVRLKWSQPIQMNLGVPTQRAAHGMCAIDRHIVIFGGRDIEDRQNDLHIFNVDNRKWLLDFEIKGQKPMPRSFHTLTAVGKKAVLFGGRGRDNQHFAQFNIFDFEKKEWIQGVVEGDCPAGRGQHSAVAIGNSVLVFGGAGHFSPETMQCQTFFTDIYSIKIDNFPGDVVTNGDVSASQKS